MKIFLYSILALGMLPVQSAEPGPTSSQVEVERQQGEAGSDNAAGDAVPAPVAPEQEEPQLTPEGYPIVFREPSDAMLHRRHLPVEIELNPAWKLTPAQMVTAMQLPRPRKDGKGYLYPEDLNPTAEQKEDGSALSDRQRSQMRRARRSAQDTASWAEYRAAKAFNKKYAAPLEQADKRGKHIRVNVSIQHGFFMDGDKELLNFTVCSGKRSTPTPTGHFHVIEKDRYHHSNLYNNASMPFYMRLTMDGVGMHQGPLAGHPASHGCIRLSSTTAQHLFKHCEVGTPVFVYADPKEARPQAPKRQTRSGRRRR